MSKRVLCVCQGGNSRSVACACLLKQKYGFDALSCGVKKNSPRTIEMLCDWAELIVVMQEKLLKYLPEHTKGKRILIDVGSDRYFRGFRHNLIDTIDKMLIERKIV